MEVILLQRIKNLGFAGDIINIKPGYARNYLLPKKMVLRATEENKKYFAEQKKQIELDNQNMKKEAEKLLPKLENKHLIIIRNASEAGHLYASVRSQDISEVLATEGFIANKNQIHISIPIKTLGVTPVELMLHPEISTNLLVNVARSKEEANGQLEAYNKSFSDEEKKSAKNIAPAEEKLPEVEETSSI